jgi:hypothetical protein
MAAILDTRWWEIHIKIFSSETTGPIATKFCGMILGWPLPKLCLVIPTFDQDGHQAKNRKKGGMAAILDTRWH